MAESTQLGEQGKAEARKARNRERERIRYQKNKEAIRSRQQSYRKEIRDSDFHKQQRRAHDKAYRKRHESQLSAYAKAYYAKNQEVIKSRYAQRYLQNKATIIARNVRNQAKRRLEDECFALAHRVYSRVRGALSRSGSAKKQRTMALVGCTAAELKGHIESLFLPQMSWANRHLWHVDHIIPLAKFDLSDPMQQEAAFHYTNLQPLWACDNLRKGDKVPGQQLFGFAYASRIVGATSAKPKIRRMHDRQSGNNQP